MVFDDLRVLRSSPSDSVQQLLKLRHKDFSNMTVKSQNVGMEEIFSILKQALTSKFTLSGVFLENRESKLSYSFSSDTGPSHYLKGSIEIKVIVSKSQNKILFAETDGDFVDFLVSFLTTPLGSILKLMNGKLCLGSIGNLYKSVKDLNPSWFIGSSNESLLNLRVAPDFGCKSSPLQEDDTPKYWHGTVIEKDNNEGRIMISKKKEMLRDPVQMKLFDPGCSDGAREPALGFMKRPCLFVVRDDLQLIPMTDTSSISYLQQLENVQLDDLEEHWVEIRKAHEALNLLRASLTSKDALTRSLFYLLKEWKCQRCIPFLGRRGTEKRKKWERKKLRDNNNMMGKKERDEKRVK